MRIDISRFVTIGLVLLLAGGCMTNDEPRLIATGELLAADGHTPLGDKVIDRYVLTFSVLDNAGDPIDIVREFIHDGRGKPIVTNGDGQFEIRSATLELSFDWERDEYVCDDVCVTWDTFCTEVNEEVCDVCTEQDCWDDCSESCYDECWDEEYCDEDGCWTETVCEEVCDESCQTVCEPVDYDCNCRWETYEECDDVCTETTEECDWLTRTYTSYRSVDEVKKTKAAVWTRDKTRRLYMIGGEQNEDATGPDCGEDGQCDQRLWFQNDRFVAPTPLVE